MNANEGETTAIIGGTGSGKSTVASLILRFHDVTSGEICLNGTDIRKMKQSFLRDHLAYVQQKAWLFSGTIQSNLCYSRKDASEEELMHAAEVAQAGEFIRSCPMGFNPLSPRAVRIFPADRSKGFPSPAPWLKKPELYIFDDSFSALDFKTDAALRKALAKETEDAAVLIIAQRVSTIRHANCIVVLNEGEMAGIGTMRNFWKPVRYIGKSMNLRQRRHRNHEKIKKLQHRGAVIRLSASPESPPHGCGYFYYPVRWSQHLESDVQRHCH